MQQGLDEAGLSYTRDYLPTDELLFIDTSFLSVCSGQRNLEYRDTRRYTNLRISRIRNLADAFEKRNNIRTIPEVLLEIDVSLSCLAGRKKKIKAINQKNYGRTSAPPVPRQDKLKQELKYLKRIYEILEARVINSIEDPELYNHVQGILPFVRDIHKREGGSSNEFETDEKLVSTTLYYAQVRPSGVCSCDVGLMKAYASCVRELPISFPDPIVCDGIHGMVFSANDYRTHEKKHNSNPDKSLRGIYK